jgi:outer membrane protein assembly factor BamE
MHNRLQSSLAIIFAVSCLAAVSCLISACSFPPRIYRMDIRQGSDITPEMIAKLRRGMSKEQVQEILGTPPLTHVLDTNRWDYYYYLKPGMGGPKIERHLSVFFSHGRVTEWSQRDTSEPPKKSKKKHGK